MHAAAAPSLQSAADGDDFVTCKMASDPDDLHRPQGWCTEPHGPSGGGACFQAKPLKATSLQPWRVSAFRATQSLSSRCDASLSRATIPTVVFIGNISSTFSQRYSCAVANAHAFGQVAGPCMQDKTLRNPYKEYF